MEQEREQTPQKRGIESELNVKRALETMRDEGLILGFRRTRHYSRADRRGIDFFIFTEVGRIPLQVKSSFAGMRVHNSYTYRMKIACVVGQGPGLLACLKRLVQNHQGKANHAAAG